MLLPSNRETRTCFEGPPATLSPLVQDRPHPSRLICALKADAEVVTIPAQGGLPPQPRLHLGRTPPGASLVESDVTQ